jgi:hypothetical protein
MTESAMQAAMRRLEQALRAETAALAARDLRGAAAMQAEKLAAAEAFVAARDALGAAERTDTRLALPLDRLREAGAENRIALERALALQARVVTTIARAAARPAAGQPPGYARSAKPASAPLAFSVRA